MLTTQARRKKRMPAITRDSLMSLEQYAKVRNEFRANVMAHKKTRTVHLGDHVTLQFEDEMTMRYQIQEMLRAERIFEDEGIRAELERVQPAGPRRQQLEGHHDDRVPRGRRAPRALCRA